MLTLPAESRIVEQADELTEPPLVDAVVPLRQCPRQRGVCRHHRGHCLVDELADAVGFRIVRQCLPARRRWHLEGAVGPLVVSVGNVFEEYQPEDDILVLTGR